MVNLIIPCVGIFYLSILVFYLPAQVTFIRKYISLQTQDVFCFIFKSKAKTGLVIAILVSQTLYLNLVIEVIPATSLTLPLLGR